VTSPFQAITTESGRYYPRLGKQYISVTTALNGLPKDALPQWAANVAADKALELHDCGALDFKNEGYRRAVRNDIRYAHKEEKEAAARLGDAVHQCCEDIVKHGDCDAPTDKKVANRVKQFWKWTQAHTIEPLYVEATVYNDTHLYAGSCDLMASVDGIPTIIDYKTSKGVYGSVALQLSAYMNGEYILTDEGLVVALPKFERAAVLHIRDRGYKFIECDSSAKTFNHFLRVLSVKRDWLDTDADTALLGEIKPATKG
jgi:hypothetical protein